MQGLLVNMVFLCRGRRGTGEKRSGDAEQPSEAAGCRAPTHRGSRGCSGIAGGGCCCGTYPAPPLLAWPAGAQPSHRDHPHPQPTPAPTSSSLFKVLEASADVIPAFLDWTRDCGKETPFPDPAEREVALPHSSGVPVAIKHLGRALTPGWGVLPAWAGSGDSPVPSDASAAKGHPALQWDWNQFNSLQHSQFIPSRAEPLYVCPSPREDQGREHLPLPAGSQTSDGGNKRLLVQVTSQQSHLLAPSLLDRVGIGAPTPHPALGQSPGDFLPQDTALAAVCQIPAGKGSCPAQPSPSAQPTNTHKPPPQNPDTDTAQCRSISGRPSGLGGGGHWSEDSDGGSRMGTVGWERVGRLGTGWRHPGEGTKWRR